jgi:uncharacterized BrkB/YihY/UPF0761 family membrane protein
VVPLLLLLVTIVGLIVGPHSRAEHEIVNSALSQFPVIGQDLGSSIRALHKPSTLAFVVSALGLLWGSLGVTNTIQRASETMWGVPRHREAALFRRVVRGLMLLGTIAAAVVGSAFLAGLSTVGGGKLNSYPGRLLVVHPDRRRGVNLGAYLLAFRILAPSDTSWRSLLPGTLIGGLGWTALEALGGACWSVTPCGTPASSTASSPLSWG